MLNEQVESVMAIAFELARIREEHGAQSGMYLSEVRALRAEVERLAAQAASAPAVRMLTPEEDHALCIEHGATVSAHLLQAIQRKFCAVNAGKRIPPDGKIGGV